MFHIVTASTNIFLAFLIGAFAFVYCGLNFPEFFQILKSGARVIKDFITDDIGLSTQAKLLLDFVIQELQFVFMFFVILSRIAIATVAWWFNSLFKAD